MKKLLVVLVLIGVAAGVFAQDVFASYNKPGDVNIYASVGWWAWPEVNVAAEYVIGEFELGPLPFDWGIAARGGFDFGAGYFGFSAGVLATLHLGVAAFPLDFYASAGVCYNSGYYPFNFASMGGLTWWFTPSMGLLLESGYLGWGFWGVGLEFKI
jgi:hypothetical protein